MPKASDNEQVNESQNSTDYSIDDMRFVPTTGKIKEKNPNRVGTVYGTFYHVDANGNRTGEPLTITQKVIDRETALSPVFAIDLDAGSLTLPSGERGRKAVAGISQDEVSAMLDALRS